MSSCHSCVEPLIDADYYWLWSYRTKLYLHHQPGARVIRWHEGCLPPGFRAYHSGAGRGDGQMATVAERRAKLEEKLAKLDPAKAAEKAETRQEKLQAEIAKLEEHKEIEGKTGKVKISSKGGGVFVNVIVLGYERKVYGRELYRVQMADGEGTMTVTRDKLQVDGE